MRHLGQIGHIDFVAYGAAECHGEFVAALGVFARLDESAHRHSLRLIVGHLYAHGAFARDRGDDSDADGRQTQCDIVGQILDAGDLDPLVGLHLVERHRRTYLGAYIRDRNAVIE